MNKKPKKGCVQIQIGNKKYTFRDVDISSTSLNSILTTLVKNKKFTDNIDEILDLANQDINQIIESNEEVATNIGSFAVGNANGINLATLSRINKSSDFNAISSLVRLLKNFSDNSFLFSTSTESSTAYIGNGRDFILLNPNSIGPKLPQIIAFKYASEQSTNKNSPIFRTLYKYVEEILNSDHPFKEHLEGMSDITAAKKLLLLSQSEESDPLIDSLLKELGGVIKNKAESAEKVNISYKSIIENNISTIIGFGDTITSFNGHDYTNKFIIEFLRNVANYTSTTPINEELFTDNIPKEFKLFYMDNQSGKYSQILNDLLFNENLEEVNLFDSKLFTSLNNIINYLYTPSEVLKDSSFIPKIGNIEVEDDYQVAEKTITINEINSLMNKAIKNSKSIELILDDSINTFSSIKKYESGRVKILINPSKPLTSEDISQIKKEITVKTGKNAGTSNKKTSWYVLKQFGISDASAVNKLTDLFKELNTNQILVSQVYSTGHDDFSIQVAKAANQAGVGIVTIFPSYYLTKNRGEFLSYLDKELNISFASSEIEKAFTGEEFYKFSSDENPGLFYKSLNKQVGDVVTIKNTISQDKMKMVINKIINFKFNPTNSNYTNMYNTYVGGFNTGVVFSLLSEQGKRVIGLLSERTDSSYTFILENNKKIQVSRSEIDNIYSNHIPLYMSDVRYIGDDVYYNTSFGIFKNDILYKNNVDVSRSFFEEELKEIFEKTTYTDYTEFLNTEFGNNYNFDAKKFYIFSPYVRGKVSKLEPNIPNYSNINMLEILSNSIRKSGIGVNIFSSEEIKKLFGVGLSENKAFIHNGTIIINSTKCTDDSPIHELMHLLMAQYKITNPDSYYEMLNSVPNLKQFEELKEHYKELSPDDYMEEVLVHAMSDYLMGRILDYGPLNITEKNFNIKSLASILLNVSEDKLNKYRDNSDFMNSLLKTILLEGDSKLLDNLSLGVNLDQTITEGRISNIKSDLITKNNLKIDCK